MSVRGKESSADFLFLFRVCFSERKIIDCLSIFKKTEVETSVFVWTLKKTVFENY